MSRRGEFGYTLFVMDPSVFDYQLPHDRIAQYPAERRDASRLLVLDRAAGVWEDRGFVDLPGLLRPGDCLVVNDSRVIPARLYARSENDALLELLFIRELAPSRWEALVRPAKRCRVGAYLTLGDGQAVARVIAGAPEGRRVVEVAEGSVSRLLEHHGLPPLPPYIRRYAKPGAEDWERYQTVYARVDGSVAAPTADRKSTRLNSSHSAKSRMPSSA